jgi:hypothetical protein
MAKRTVKNSSSQPLYLNLPGGRSLKIPARGNAEVEEADLSSSEMALHQSRGNIILVEATTAGEKATEQDQKSQKAETDSQPAEKAKDDEGGKE